MRENSKHELEVGSLGPKCIYRPLIPAGNGKKRSRAAFVVECDHGIEERVVREEGESVRAIRSRGRRRSQGRTDEDWRTACNSDGMIAVSTGALKPLEKEGKASVLVHGVFLILGVATGR